MTQSQRNNDFRPFEFILNCILMVALLCLIFSCGSRKTSRSQIDTSTRTIQAQTTKKDSTATSIIDSSFDIFSDEITLEPIDTAKQITIIDSAGKVTRYGNVKIVRKKIIDKTKRTEEKKASKTVEQSVASSTQMVQSATSRDTQREQFDIIGMILQYWWLWLVIIAAVLIYKKIIKVYT